MSVSDPIPELSQDLASASRRRPFGLLQMLGSALCVFGLAFLLAGERVTPGEPKAPASQPPAAPTGAVFAGAAGVLPSPILLGWVSVVRLEGRTLALGKLDACGEEGPPVAARLPRPDQELREGFLLLDPLRQEPLEVWRRLSLPGAQRPNHGLDIALDLYAYELHPGSSVEPLTLADALPAVGTSVWVYAPRAPSPEPAELILGEVALASPEGLVIRIGGREIAGLGGAPWLDASGQVVGLTAAATEQERGVLVYALPATRARELLANSTPLDPSPDR